MHEEYNADTGKYSRNGDSCDAKVIYQNNKSGNEPRFCLIEKKDASWDKEMKPSYSIGWKCTDDYYVLGLPIEADDIRELKRIIDIMLSTQSKSKD